MVSSGSLPFTVDVTTLPNDPFSSRETISQPSSSEFTSSGSSPSQDPSASFQDSSLGALLPIEENGVDSKYTKSSRIVDDPYDPRTYTCQGCLTDWPSQSAETAASGFVIEDNDDSMER